MTQSAVESPTEAELGPLRSLIVDLLETELSQPLPELRSAVQADFEADSVTVDSLLIVSIIVAVERRLNITISNDELTAPRLRSLGAFTKFIFSKVAAAATGAAERQSR